jgi:FkbM family methyltransferase
MKIENLVIDFSTDPFNPEKNFAIALEYEKLNQTASAVSFYLRAAEYGYETHPEIVYTSLLKMSQCFQRQGDRAATVHNNISQAITYLPERPEAYFLMSQFYELNQQPQNAYSFASMGLSITSGKSFKRLPAPTGYHGSFCLKLAKGINAFMIGRREESYELLLHLSEMNLPFEYHNIVLRALEDFGMKVSDDLFIPLEPVITNYRKYFGKNADVVIDIGTRDGNDAAYFNKKLRSNITIAIDANPEAIGITKERYPWMNVLYTAVSDSDGETSFQQVLSDNESMAGCSSIYANKVANEPQFFEIVNNITVPMTRMDTLLEDCNLADTIDVVKVDVEGYTWEVLQGFGDRLKDVKLFHLETEVEPTHANHKNNAEICEWMEKQGFVLVDISYEGSNGINGGIEDQVWVNPIHAIRNRECFIF